MALAWVRGNVAASSGDPARVRIGGESAGAKLTDMQMGLPSAHSLFHQMISESGGAERVWLREQAAAIAAGFARQWRAQIGRETAALTTAPAADLL